MQGSLNRRVRFAVFKRDKFTCRYCGANRQDGAVLQIDHIIPASQGGAHDYLNLVTACRDCNQGKFDKDLKLREVPRSAPTDDGEMLDGEDVDCFTKCMTDLTSAALELRRVAKRLLAHLDEEEDSHLTQGDGE